MIRKEFQRIKSDPLSLFLMLAVPFLVISVLGLSTRQELSTEMNIALISKDRIPDADLLFQETPINESNRYEVFFENLIRYDSEMSYLEKSFILTSRAEEEGILNELYDDIRNDTIEMILILPSNFSESIEYGYNVSIEVIYDDSDPENKNHVENVIQELFALCYVNIAEVEAGDLPFGRSLPAKFVIIRSEYEFLVEEGPTRILKLTTPLIVPVSLISMTMMLTAQTLIVEDPLSRLLLTPSSKRDVLLSKWIVYGTIAVIQCLIVFLMLLVFGLTSEGPMALVFGLLILSAWCGIAIGTFISSLSPTAPVATQLYIVFYLASLLLSGFFVPPAKTSTTMLIVSQFFPIWHARIAINELLFLGTIAWEEFAWLGGLIMGYSILARIFYGLKKIEA